MTTGPRAPLRPGRLLGAALLVALAACGSDRDAAPADAALSTPATAAPPAGSGAAAGEAGGFEAELSRYALTLDGVRAAARVNRTLMAAAEADPALRARWEAMDDGGDEESAGDYAAFEEMARRMEDEPVAQRALRDAGLSAREYALVTGALFQGGFVAMAREQDPSAEVPAGVNPDNVEFVIRNRAELERIGGTGEG